MHSLSSTMHTRANGGVSPWVSFACRLPCRQHAAPASQGTQSAPGQVPGVGPWVPLAHHGLGCMQAVPGLRACQCTHHEASCRESGIKGVYACAAPLWGRNFVRLMWLSICYAIMQFGITAVRIQLSFQSSCNAQTHALHTNFGLSILST